MLEHLIDRKFKFANFSNQARKRFIKGALIRAKGLDVNDTGYVDAIKAVRGTQGTPIKSKSPFVRDLAQNAPYLSDPGDLSYINRSFTDTIRNAPVDYGEAGSMLVKTGKGIAPTAKEAKRSIRNIETMHLGTQPGMGFIPPATVPAKGRGAAMLHTHPLTDIAAPSLQDAVAFPAIRAMADLDTQTTGLIAPGSRINSYVAHKTRPGKYDLLKYDDNPKAYGRRGRQYLFEADDAQRNKMLSDRMDRIRKPLNELGYDEDGVKMQAGNSMLIPKRVVDGYGFDKFYEAALTQTPRAIDLAFDIPEDAIRSTQSSVWPRIKNDTELLQQRKRLSQLGREAYNRTGFNTQYLGRYNER